MSETKPKLIFMGTGSFAGTILNALLRNRHLMSRDLIDRKTSNVYFDIAGVFTKPDKTIHKNSEPNENQVKELAQKNNLPIYQPEKLDAEITTKIKEINPDLIVIVAYGKIIPREIIAIPKFGCVNVHPSLLPKFRGPSPIQNALLVSEKETGTSIMLINDRVDAGDVLAQEKIAIDPDDTYPMLSEKLALLSSELLLKTLPLWIDGKIAPQKQDESQATLCQLIDRQDGLIVWEEEAKKIYDRYRALSPWPGIFSFWKKEKTPLRLKLQKIELAKGNMLSENLPGKVFQSSGQIAVGTLNGAIILQEVQLEGKKSVSIKDFVNGHSDFVGSVLQ